MRDVECRGVLIKTLHSSTTNSFLIDRHEHFGEATVKSFMQQIFTALDHMHDKGVFHRDIKVRRRYTSRSRHCHRPQSARTLTLTLFTAREHSR